MVLIVVVAGVVVRTWIRLILSVADDVYFSGVSLSIARIYKYLIVKKVTVIALIDF